LFCDDVFCDDNILQAKNKQDLKKKKEYSLSLLQREHYLLQHLRHWNILTSYGGCVVDTGNEVEIGLVTEFIECTL
jgi:hypothetical protein